MYGTPGPGYQGHNEAENQENKQEIEQPTNEPDPILRVGPPRKVKMIYPEYCCLYPTIFLRGGVAACEQSCPEEVRENAKCQRNGWHTGKDR